ncbi:hypothetical protein [Staphylococcus cornubiensis]|uniref:hypothetical protein n=1 Tax=Staphylococcus cornubiensis TaxID=1986155 RepID=UPI000A3C9177|nr:hypothetical protein [Staphylococcus cornubiensis]
MNCYEIPNYMQALKVLNELLDLTTTYDFVYTRNREQAQEILATIETKVHTYYEQLPQPVYTHAYSAYPYDLFYACLHNLYHHPLVHTEFGSQSQLNQSYIQQIIRTQSYFQMPYVEL